MCTEVTKGENSREWGSDIKERKRKEGEGRGSDDFREDGVGKLNAANIDIIVMLPELRVEN